ncbi:hypothetical protein [Acidiphilium sp.]|uniref:hypothetical protein n=1 Tax=Acidiphilium sp. TaxID=527 RepID=UPI003D077FD8
MVGITSPQQLETLRIYAAGQIGTRAAIERAGLHDYADLIIALSQNDLSLPRPAETAAHEARLARAQAILLPRLRHDD